MTQYNTSNVKLSNSQLDELKSAIEDGTEVVLRLSSNMIGDSDNQSNFLHELLLTIRKVSNLRKVLLTNHQLILSYQKLRHTDDKIWRISC